MFRKYVKSSNLFLALLIPGGVFIIVSFFSTFGQFPILMFLGVFLILIYLISTFYEKHVDDYLILEDPTRKLRSYPGDDEMIEFHIIQKGILPIINARLEITYDQVLESQFEDKNHQTDTETIQLPLTLLSFEEKNISLPVQSVRRGIGKIRSIRIYIPNIMGLGQINLSYNKIYKQEIIIYPSLKQVEGLNLIEPSNSGDQQAQHSIFEQPLLQYGTRDYVSGDPFNRIHWKATARKQELQTKIVEKVNQLSWCFMLNIKVHHGVNLFSEIENYLEYTAYMCRYATEHNIPFEIYINVRGFKGLPYVHLPLGEGKNHYMRALELLARINPLGLTANYTHTLEQASHQNKAPYIIQIGSFNASQQRIFKEWINQGHSIYYLNEAQQAEILPLLMKGGISNHA
ncbi:DUF58 domain-containing protein [Filobacillus milosensis]|uniref:DUF58 domain-containing protein n=1 Tax=Filobacillus milosensis TaxID=94137 RepID=A0A4Y8ILB8_9BACI|nr:DUF58 domain-containing protein [Filobacillus milosensis]TFB22099.1 DUF58 domain-containing protein [Filobacillus milosensis]